MKFQTVLDRLQRFPIPEGWKGNLFLLPDEHMAAIYDCIVKNQLRSCLELGTGFGATTCVIAAALEESGGGRITTIDLFVHEPVNVKILHRHCGLDQPIQATGDPLGYNWVMADMISAQNAASADAPRFDFCLLDGAHQWEPDALAFTLATELLDPGAFLVLDDLNFNLRMVPNCKEVFGNLTDRELDAFQMQMVWSLLVARSPQYSGFRITEDGRMGWAVKKPSTNEPPGMSRRGSWFRRIGLG